MKKFPYFTTFAVTLSVLLCVSIGYFISTCIVSTNLFQLTKKVESAQTSYYALSIFSSDSEEDLNAVKSEFQNKNCAGYIFKSDKFYLVASVYKNINDAELVKNNLNVNGYNAEVIKINIPTFYLEGNFSSQEEEILRLALNCKDKIFENLYDISISLDTQIISETEAKLKVNETYSSFETTKNNFETIFKSSHLNDIEKLRDEIERVEEILENLTKENLEENQTYSSLIKITYCKILLDEINEN